MKVEQGNVYSKLHGTPDELAWARDNLKFEVKHFRNGQYGTDTIRMVSALDGTFPSGMIATLEYMARSRLLPFEVGPSPKPPVIPDLAADLEWLRDYQRLAVDVGAGLQQSPVLLVKKVDAWVHRGVFKAPTGSGKTEIAAGLAKRLPCRWLFLVHRASLMDQAAERYEKRTGLPAGRVGDGRWEPQERFTAATFQTIGRTMGEQRTRALLQSAEGLIVDEAHVLPADSFYRVAMACPAHFRFGLSATPAERDDRRSVLAVAALGPVIYEIKPETLIAAGVIARPLIKLMPVHQESTKPTWQGVYGECVVRGAPRNRALVDMAQWAEKPCLVFVKQVNHGQLLSKMLSRAGVKVNFVWGNVSVEARKEAIEKLVRGDHEVLICSVIFQEGVDIPELRSVVIGSGGRSIIAALQRIGRGMRIAPGKNTFEVWDCRDYGNKWLERHSNVRTQAYQSQGYETTVLPTAVGPTV